MKTKQASLIRRHSWLILLLLGILSLALPLASAQSNPSDEDNSRTWHTASKTKLGISASNVSGELAARILSAQMPLILDVDDLGDDRFVMPVQTTLPWGAIGFVDNGCTGVLIDSQHVLAAAHCFVYDFNNAGVWQQGDWQTGLTFFPNYHPDRSNPPRYAIDRMVVGTRVQTGGEFIASDWGIGHLAAPVMDFPVLEIQPAPSSIYPLNVTISGYARDHNFFPNVRFPQPAPGGYCKFFGKNCWWTPALVEPTCDALNDIGHYIQLSPRGCSIHGGNSGSPIMWNVGDPGSLDFNITGVIHGVDGGPGAARFLYAPRFAAGVALATNDDGAARSQVFAIDSDTSQVVRRFRQGASVDDSFTTFNSLGQVPSPGRIAAARLTNNRPQVFVISDSTDLYTAYVDTANNWQVWRILDLPAGVTSILDVDVAYDVNGINQLYILGNGRAYTRRRLSSDPYAEWGSWQAIGTQRAAGYVRISAVKRADGTQQAFLVHRQGAVHTLWQTSPSPDSGWTPTLPFLDETGRLSTVSDLDAGLTEDGQVQVIAIAGDGITWIRTMRTNSPADDWNPWDRWPAMLFAPQASNPPVIFDLKTLTVDQLQERTSGDIIPVVFATDSQGNIYFTTHSKIGGWQPLRSFYH